MALLRAGKRSCYAAAGAGSKCEGGIFQVMNTEHSIQNRPKRILFVNPAKKEGFYTDRIHMGLSLLGSILSKEGHEVKIIDYAYLRSLRQCPSIESIINDFLPDVISVTIFTYHYTACQEMLDRISKCSNAPIIVGGPHVTLFPQDFMNDKRISYIVRGEAEKIIAETVRNASHQLVPVVINAPAPEPQEIPEVNLGIAAGSEFLKDYQIQLSRGCPFTCSFCNVKSIAGRKVRARDLDTCIHQIEKALAEFPNIESVSITDDCPTFNKERFKQFLKKFASKKFNVTLTIDNMRADLIDEEMLDLYVSAGGKNICLGVESAHPEVFKMVHKSESLDDIVKAARLIKKFNLQLGMCFVIGLPGDTMERHLSSIKLAKELKPDYAFWNMCTPWPGTEVHEWFKENGTIGDLRDFSTLIVPKFIFQDPPVTSAQFGKEDRIRAWLMANLETNSLLFFSFGIRNIGGFVSEFIVLLRLAKKYKLIKSVPVYMGYTVKRFLLETRNYLAATRRSKSHPGHKQI